MVIVRNLILFGTISFSLISCGKMPIATTFEPEGALVIKTQFVQTTLSKRTGVLDDSFDSLVVEISASDISTPIHKCISISKSAPAEIDTISSIPAGTERIVTIWTKNKNGVIVNRDSITSHSVVIESGRSTSVNAVLLPAAGSIFIQLGNVPTSVDSLKATFTSLTGQIWSANVKRSARVYIAIDLVPNKTEGTLKVEALDVSGVVLYTAQSKLTFNAQEMNNISLSFSSGGGSLSLSTTIVYPGTTVASASFGTQETAVNESGTCIITEIMYAANDSEYIEVFNPCSTSQAFDTLTIEIDGTKRYFTNVSIAPKDYYVFGRKTMPWVDQAHPTSSALDLSSNGNWITLRAKNQILDQVIFSDAASGLDWPQVNGKRSIELDKSHYSAKDNNFGRNWQCSTKLIESTGTQYGTPGA